MGGARNDRVRLVGRRYRLIDKIGSGGMGTVWRAHDDLLGRPVAVKEINLPPDVSGFDRDELRQRTMREARAAARLSHPNAVTVHDVIEEDGQPWIVMQLVDSDSLSDVIETSGALAPRRVAEIGLAILGALEAAHKAGILHRDVKPANVLLGHDGRVVLTDFGVATLEGDPALTGTGFLLGSPPYMAPERPLGKPIGPASDLWSLGATMYAAVDGQPPYDQETPMAILIALATQDPPLRGPRARLPTSLKVSCNAIPNVDWIPTKHGGSYKPHSARQLNHRPARNRYLIHNRSLSRRRPSGPRSLAVGLPSSVLRSNLCRSACRRTLASRCATTGRARMGQSRCSSATKALRTPSARPTGCSSFSAVASSTSCWAYQVGKT